ncbi:MAG: exonuclease domain-containing protein [Enterocloster bolteae]
MTSGRIHREYKAVVFFDTETTGLDAESCQIIELAAIQIEKPNGHPPHELTAPTCSMKACRKVSGSPDASSS